MAKKSTTSEQIKKAIRTKPEKPTVEFLSTGSTLLNLALSDSPWKGFAKGKYYSLVGDSTSGKTFLSLTCLAEAAADPQFDEYRFIFDDSEGGAMMNFEKFFGPKMVARLEPPAKHSDGSPRYSETIEDMYFFLQDAVDAGRPFIYIEDSMDAISSRQEITKFVDTRKAARSKTQKKVAGDYGDGKAKTNSRHLRIINAGLRDTGSILITISQTRDTMDMFNPKGHSGGKALKFYSCAQIWSSCGGQIKKTVKGKERIIGTESVIRVRKNRTTGKDRKVRIPIYYDYGMDDIGSCIDYLIDEGHWDGGDRIDTGDDFGGVLKRSELIKRIESEGLEKDLRSLVSDVWHEIERACAQNRKSRYE